MGKLDINCEPLINGIMVWWHKTADAARYIIKLFIGENEIAIRYIDKEDSYYSFTNLSSKIGMYGVRVFVENRNGEIMCKSECIPCKVGEFNSNQYSLPHNGNW